MNLVIFLSRNLLLLVRVVQIYLFPGISALKLPPAYHAVQQALPLTPDYYMYLPSSGGAGCYIKPDSHICTVIMYWHTNIYIYKPYIHKYIVINGKGTAAWDFFCLNWLCQKYATRDLKQFRTRIPICWDIWHSRCFRAMGHCGNFGYTLWATAANLVMHCGPLRRSWL
jgi:hypothetical protein